ncbi:DNA-deoxyinosine glycosylase [Marnyiella aurantia]|uniref:DNA-deoxyinosine glycosylase n=1 Tax=Marnyiella aurantia TaxID=2758037 RepID=A0A7D7LS58_9FLAO|nr:DNA-deoxyinosine glycosylase [Marnyiella aurantia]MBA5246052.1 DNA-deoxyinosine glycosylase [Marnyiella aurantia]QMS98557.1 DNA-deoxyinosine glycosylase [Marnyiella aurantia]
MTIRIASFPPIISETSEILILGSVPGVRSLKAQEYYAHPQNHFWKIVFQLFGGEFTPNYAQKLDFLTDNKIALWDVIETCERKGSLDTEIRNEESNDIPALLAEFPNIKAVFCNGQKAHKNLLKMVGKDYDLPIFVLPSTSPLHTIGFEKKLEAWTLIKDYV